VSKTPTPYAQGAVVFVNLEPVQGSEQGRKRPCVIVSDLKKILASRSKPLYLVVPLTRSETLTGALAPRLTARKGGVPANSVALVMHLRSVDPSRIEKRVGHLNASELAAVLGGISDMMGRESSGGKTESQKR
jgi:mRNA interferase MazF